MKPSTVRLVAIGIGVFLVFGLLSALATGDTAGARDIAGAVVALAAIGGLAALARRIRTEPRRDATQDAARDLGLGFAARDVFGLIDLPFPLFQRVVTVRGLDNVMFGTWRGSDVKVFEYWYARSSDPSIDDYERFSCLMTPIPSHWPDLQITPETLVTRAVGRLTTQEIDMESESFNRAFTVRSADRRFARALLDAQMMRWLLDLGGRWGFEIVGGTLLCYRSPRLEPWTLEPFLESGMDFVDRIPNVVRSLFPEPTIDI